MTSFTKTGLTAGVKYTFVVQSRSDYGLSDYSTPKQILAGQIPDKPAAPTTEVSGSNVIIKWVAPNNRGSDIFAYTITIR